LTTNVSNVGDDPFARLLEVMHQLRAPGGCPWDREQTHQTLRPYLIEEAYEVLEAIEQGDDSELCEELGDLLLQVVFHAELAQERGAFDYNAVARGLTEKLVRRHPHVFADVEANDVEAVARNWSQIKSAERIAKAEKKGLGAPSAIDGIPRAMPALLRAHRIGEKAGKVGVDWRSAADVPAKIHEELAEVTEARTHEERGRELGDLLLAVASYCRLNGHDPETSLHGAIDRFDARFRSMESEAATSDRPLSEQTRSELDEAWTRAKRRTGIDSPPTSE
jgi:tetrapyrrole methylase family protein/MazG family protein